MFLRDDMRTWFFRVLTPKLRMEADRWNALVEMGMGNWEMGGTLTFPHGSALEQTPRGLHLVGISSGMK
jgi:hypothetical protein